MQLKGCEVHILREYCDYISFCELKIEPSNEYIRRIYIKRSGSCEDVKNERTFVLVMPGTRARCKIQFLFVYSLDFSNVTRAKM